MYSEKHFWDFFSFTNKKEKANKPKDKHLYSTVNDFQTNFWTTIKTV